MKRIDNRSKHARRLAAAGALCTAIALSSGAALADVTIGLIVPATGSTAALGIPAKNAAIFFPEEIAGEKVRLIVVDDASDPTTGTTQARRLATEEKADVLLGSVMTGSAIAIAGVARELEIPQIALSPVDLPAGSDHWTFRMPQNVGLMAKALVANMKAAGVKTLGYIGFTDAWGDVWVRNMKPLMDAEGMKMVAEERYARADTTVTGQVLKVMAARPDAVLIGASGTAAGLPQVTLRERGYKGRIYQTHGAVTRDIIRIGGKAVEGAVFAAGPVVVAEQLPDDSAVKPQGLKFVAAYEGKYGKDSRNQFAAHVYDSALVLERVIPVALKKAKPGTPEFRAAIRDALESEKEIKASQGVYNYTKDDHFGLDTRGAVLITIENGDWKLLP